MKKAIYLPFLAVVLFASCSPSTTTVVPTDTAAPPTDTPRPEYTATQTLTPTLAALKPIEKSDVSGLAYPQGSDWENPGTEPGTIKVLDWAGFNAALSYTFDDGQPSQVAHYEELNAQGVPLTFYICEGWSNTSPNFVEVWSQAAADGHEIGNHTVNHPHAGLADTGTGKGPLETQSLEISQNAEYITNTISHQPVWSFAAPYGDRGWIPYAAEFYFVNRGVAYGTISPMDSTDPWNLPVFMANGGESEKVLNEEIGYARAGGKWLIFLFHALLPTSQNWYAGVEVENVTGSIYYARASGDVWIDALYKVAAYWIGQKIVAEAEPEVSGGDYVYNWTLPENFPTGMYLRVTVRGTISQNGAPLPWDKHGFYEIALDAGSLTLTP
jgi:peptidoglycan/xylan/chitin deacetylase (PgdA/CDA1 family)